MRKVKADDQATLLEYNTLKESKLSRWEKITWVLT